MSELLPAAQMHPRSLLTVLTVYGEPASCTSRVQRHGAAAKRRSKGEGEARRGGTVCCHVMSDVVFGTNDSDKKSWWYIIIATKFQHRVCNLYRSSDRRGILRLFPSQNTPYLSKRLVKRNKDNEKQPWKYSRPLHERPLKRPLERRIESATSRESR